MGDVTEEEWEKENGLRRGEKTNVSVFSPTHL